MGGAEAGVREVGVGVQGVECNEWRVQEVWEGWGGGASGWCVRVEGRERKGEERGEGGGDMVRRMEIQLGWTELGRVSGVCEGRGEEKGRLEVQGGVERHRGEGG